MNAHQYVIDIGLSEAQKILDDAPQGATDFVLWTGKIRYIDSLKSEIHSEKYGGWCQANQMVLNLKNSLQEVKKAIADFELIEFYGGSLEGAKQVIEFANGCSILKIRGQEIKTQFLCDAVERIEGAGGG